MRTVWLLMGIFLLLALANCYPNDGEKRSNHQVKLTFEIDHELVKKIKKASREILSDMVSGMYQVNNFLLNATKALFY